MSGVEDLSKVRIEPHRGIATTMAFIEAAMGADAAASVTVILRDAAMPPGFTGTTILDIDDHSPAGVAGPARTVGFGSTAEYRAIDVRTTALGTTFSCVTAEGETPVRLGVIGERHVVPVLAAIAVAVESGIALAEAVKRVEALVTVEPGNFEVLAAPDVLLVDDGYDPGLRSSVEALKTVAEICDDGRRSIAVLGQLDVASNDPIEIRDELDRLGRIIVRLNLGQLVVVGKDGRHLSTAASLEGSWNGESVLVGTTEEAYDLLRAEIREGDVVLVKIGKHGSALAQRLAEALA